MYLYKANKALVEKSKNKVTYEPHQKMQQNIISIKSIQF